MLLAAQGWRTKFRDSSSRLPRLEFEVRYGASASTHLEFSAGRNLVKNTIKSLIKKFLGGTGSSRGKEEDVVAREAGTGGRKIEGEKVVREAVARWGMRNRRGTGEWRKEGGRRVWGEVKEGWGMKDEERQNTKIESAKQERNSPMSLAVKWGKHE